MLPKPINTMGYLLLLGHSEYFIIITAAVAIDASH